MTACQRPACTVPAGKWTRGYCESHYRKLVRMGIYGFLDATEVMRHLHGLRELGWTWEQIGDAAGVSHAVPYGLWTGRYKRIRNEGLKALLAVPLVPRMSQRSIDGTGTYRRCEALLWMGWPWAEISKRVGLRLYTLATFKTRREPVTFATAAKVKATYDELAHLPGPSKICATKARRAGYAPPLAWDDDTIDDPAARPNFGVTEQGTDRDDVLFLASFGNSDHGIATQMGVSVHHVRKIKREAVA